MSKKKRKKKKFQKNRNYYFLTITSIKNGNRSPSQINQVHNLICTPFSFAGSFYMIHSYFKSCTKSFSSRLVFCLALSDLLSICDLIDVIEHASSQNCPIVGFLRIYESIPTCSGPLKFLSVLFVQFMLEFAGVERLFPYLVISNILGSLALNLVTLYQQSFGGELSFEDYNGECFIYPPSSYA